MPPLSCAPIPPQPSGLAFRSLADAHGSSSSWSTRLQPGFVFDSSAAGPVPTGARVRGAMAGFLEKAETWEILPEESGR